MVLPVPEEPARGRTPVLQDELAAVVAGRADALEQMRGGEGLQARTRVGGQAPVPQVDLGLLAQ